MMKTSCLHIAFSYLIILLLSYPFCCSSQKPLNTSTANEEALLAFKSGITSDPHNILENWSTTRNASVCTWIGITCSTKHRITSLNLSRYDLEGTIAPHIANLTFLHSIDLSHNYFEGPLPDQFIHLRRLEEINLAENNLTGDIPSWISSFSQLRVLILHNNDFSGTIPNMLNLSKLEILLMSHNSVHGNIPQEIGNLSKLQSLELSYNHLMGFIPPGIFNISSLVTFHITSNNVSGTLPVNMCDNLPVLTDLVVPLNQLGGSIPPNVHKCKALEYLSLSFNQFSGRIPREIGELTRLKILYLGMNNFEDYAGGLPEEIGNLTHLEILNMRQSPLTVTGEHSMPFWIFNMSSLIEIDLSCNGLVGNFPMYIHHNLPNLEWLNLAVNQLSGQILPTLLDSKKLLHVELRTNHFTGHIPKQLGNLTELKFLVLRQNNMTGEIPSELGKLNLERFSVLENKFSGPIPDPIFNISTLIELDFSQNAFTGQLPQNMGRALPVLQGLYLNLNSFTGQIPTSIVNASKLEIISLSVNSLTGPVPDFGKLTSLKELVMAGNDLTGDLGFLTSCRNLEIFEVSSNQFNTTLPPSIGNLSTSLKNFRASDCLLKGSIPLDIGNLSLLEGLVLDGNELTGFFPYSIGKLKQLGVIYLENNRLEGPIPSELCGLSSLVDLYLSGNMLNGTIPSCLGEAKSIRRLFLDSNRLYSEVPNLWNLTDLWGLNLSSNFLTGGLSSEIGTLKTLVDLDLSWNRFSGDIPVSIGSLNALVTLSLSHNELEGVIPQSFGNLRGLEHLDLSNNNLSGTIPKSLEALANLGYLNLSYNRLDGEIPTGGHFENFTSQSFLHNHALCGVARLSVPLCRIRYHKRLSSKQVVYLIVVVIASAIFAVAMMVWLIRRKNVNGLRTQVEISPNLSWRRVSYQELIQATDNFSEANALGSGSFGSVFKGKLSVDELDVAVKVFNLQTEHAIKSFDVECEVMSNIRHRNLVRVLSCCSNVEFKALVLEYMPNGSLERWLYSHNYSLDLLKRLDIAIDVALALEYLHHGNMFPVVHCDLKPSNVLLDQDMIAHISDFGIAKLFGEGDVTFQTITLATVGYMAPEYGSEGIVSTSGDVYSYGIMLLEIFTRKRPTDDMFEGEMDLKHWVSEALQQNEMDEVVAPGLLVYEDEHLIVKEQCIYSIFVLALKCSATTPEERINMTESVVALKKIKATFLASTRRNRTAAPNTRESMISRN